MDTTLDVNERQKLRLQKWRARKKALKEYTKEWLDDRYLKKVSQESDFDDVEDDIDAGAFESTRKLFPERSRLVYLFDKHLTCRDELR